MADRTPVRQTNTARDSGTVFAVQDGDLHIHQRIGTHLIEELEFGPTPPVSGEQPSRLLSAENRVVAFTGRDHEIAELTGWRDGDAAVAVRLVHGGAGQGKTRLAHRFAELSRRAGWLVSRARHSRDVAVRPVEVPAGNAVVASARLLVLVDYAERWPLSDLLALIHDQRLHGGPALRILLLARPLDNWWHGLTHRLSQSLGIHPDSVELAPLGASGADSRSAFEVARTCFAKVLGVTEPITASPPEVGGSVLTIHMAALATVLAARDGDRPPVDPDELSAYLLVRERNHWLAMYENERRIESRPQVIGRAVYVAALTRALDFPAAVEALRLTGVADTSAGASQTLDDHAMCYPPHDPETRLEPLYPDRLAEDFVALQTPGHGVGGFRADPWAGGALTELMTAGPRTVATTLPLLVEAASRWPHLTERHLLPLLRKRPDLAVEAGTVALSALAAARTIPLDVLAAIESMLPPDPPPDLHAGIAAVTERLAADLSRHTVDPVRAARVLQKLGWRLLNAGRIDHGVAMLVEATAATRLLYAEDRAAHAAQFEFALRTLGRAHLRVEDWAEAAGALGEAVGLWSSGDLDSPPPPEEVATCLSELSLALWRTGETTSSLSTRHRAIAQLRRLVTDHPQYRITLVRALIQQADQLRRDKRAGPSLDALDEAVKLLRALTATAEPGLELDFAAALLGRARTLRSLGRLPEADHAAAGAVRVFRNLAGLDIAYDQDLAWALETQSQIHAALGWWTSAVAAQENAIAIHRRLSRINLERYGPALARELIDFARLCRDAGLRYQDALGALTEATTLLNTDHFDPASQDRLRSVAWTLTVDLLDASGRHADADAMRRNEQEPPPPPKARKKSLIGESERRLGRTLGNLSPSAASQRLERLPYIDMAAALIVAVPSRRWLTQLMAHFFPYVQQQIVEALIIHEELLNAPVLLSFVRRRILRLPARHVALLVQHRTSFSIAMAIFPRDDEELRDAVLAELDRHLADRIRRRLASDPPE
ncbi:tetratricopeptide (TPR) repeat protein [Actinoplanes campanulatus]|uniref:Tetratricopeptide (TPR) repeat protein n=1 Tax=Actinoplanes campanulatus TaxID=113559 RepID=A0A7W5AG68_9ACTN|nr:hypothetical protein [Actinoplanes campanulatus]MBB3095613.1 tetratricopeptide (TPR) repeat protein [Actinoplanes campanulatus]GGN10267.1 hypothetical protein GCM10010109_19890 [Actinoplanes campanulatus]GID36507.1 hypothetical protein Aca09nite_30130 [Actinoplanes campanulatus]